MRAAKRSRRKRNARISSSFARSCFSNFRAGGTPRRSVPLSVIDQSWPNPRVKRVMSPAG
jgi:hypothetical protein